MNIIDLYHILTTDKGTWHSYIEQFYKPRFEPLKDAELNILELGVFYGGSMNLWRQWFSKAKLTGIDTDPNALNYARSFIPNVELIQADGYVMETVNRFPDNHFDFIIEDGPHNVESQIFAAKEWTKKLKPGGTLVIEDIAVPETYVPMIEEQVDINMFTITRHDYRMHKNRYDDYILEIKKH